MSDGSKYSSITSMTFGADSLLGFVGFACTLASVLNLYSNASLAFLGEEYSLYCRLALSLGMVAAFALICASAYRLSSNRHPVELALPLIGLLFYALVLFAADRLFPAVVMASFVVLGMGLGVLLSLWFLCMCLQATKALPFLVSLGFAGALAIVLLEGHLQEQAAKIAQIAIWALSSLCFAALRRADADKEKTSAVKNAESDRRSRITLDSAIMFSTTSFHFGYLISVSNSYGLAQWCLLTALIVIVALVVDYSKKGFINERSISHITPPLVMVAYSGMFLFGSSLRLVCLCLLTALFVVYTILGWAAMVEHVRLASLSPLRVYAKARRWDYLALSLGLLVGFFASLAAVESDYRNAAQIGVTTAVLYAFVASFFHKPRYPETRITPDSSTGSDGNEGLWKKRCRVLSEKHGLSDRQHEVLLLMAQGRSAKYIHQTLTISLSTAQTHIRNIYRKTGIHNREELLNLIESTKLYGED